MIQIRNSVFETNSSSTHSIAIPKKCDKIENHIYFGTGEYGWENDVIHDTASYLYTAILDAYDEPERIKKLAKLTAILNEHGIAYEFEKPKWIDSWYGNKVLDNGYINHAYETRELVETLLDDEDMLLRYLSAGVVYTGNDNQDQQPDGCNIAKDYMWDDDKDMEVSNPYHDEERYDYFYKGN